MDIIDIITVIDRVARGPRILLNPIFPAIPHFERKLIANVNKKIKDEYISILKCHVERINSYGRHFNPHQITFFCWKFPGRHDWDPELKFGDKPRIKLVRFKLEFNDDKILTGYFNALDGVFCHISYSEDPRFFAKLGKYKLTILSGAIADKGEVPEDGLVF